ncbi:hypothetical protein G9G63_21100 [Paenibacillus sp. EKM202P]|uniref:hypothetical protein n=1 Tax=unclassified Paenibacillus TaxID=185978 RepID=UPI0013E9ED2A|nr:MULTISPECIES: hypothetical protein [unclassified Paenibacillus]KAF6561248.1 hypothetical protein G9G63_21100 [Paenibacillus sp. EKM202P]KAF6566116.1 hypothetical protein G9G64_20020 [Paenibacillus sp. EKM207P]
MSEKQSSNTIHSDIIESMIGIEVKVKIKGILPLVKGWSREYKEFVIAVEANQDRSDFEVYFLLKYKGKKRAVGYSRLLSQVQIATVECGEMIDIHHSEVQKLLEYLRFKL